MGSLHGVNPSRPSRIHAQTSDDIRAVLAVLGVTMTQCPLDVLSSYGTGTLGTSLSQLFSPSRDRQPRHFVKVIVSHADCAESYLSMPEFLRR